MLGKKLSVGLGVLGAATASLCMFSSTAFADYGPGPGDVVGVGSDTVQAASNFVSDGSYTGSAGYNSAGNTHKIVNFDATADANTRLAYGPQGVGTGTSAATNNCAPGTGGTAGTGNQAGLHLGDQPCTLNPTIIVRAGAAPIQRPNGSGAGYALLKADTDTAGNGTGYVDYSRSSSNQNTDSGGVKNPFFDSITLGNDPLAMLKSSTSSNAVPLSATQLGSIYSCSSTALTWNQVGGTSTATIKPLLPQIGSGTRKSFLAAIGNITPGNCVANVEENDPEAIDASGDPTNAIEPMSGGRLNLFKGLRGDGTATGSNYFTDPSCPALTTAAACATPALNPNVTLITTGTPSTGGALFNISRPLYIYFRHADLQNATVFQPGGTLNWVRTILANPCSGAGHTTGCVTIGGITYGPGGAPYYATAAGQADVSVSGIAPTYAYNTPAP